MQSMIITAVLLGALQITIKADAKLVKCPERSEAPFTVNIPHETECRKFYICQNGKKIEMNCPRSLQFNAKTQTCDWPEKAKCLLKSKMSECESPDCSNKSRKEKPSRCIEDSRHIPHETNCKKYYRCVYGKEVLKICPDNMLFNTELGNCDFKYNVQCGTLATENEFKREITYYDDFLDDHFETTTKNILADPDTEYWEDFLQEKFDQTTTDSEYVTVDYLKDLGKQQFPNECPEFSHPYEPTLLPHEKKCNAYYKCLNGKKQTIYCPGMLQFNPRILMCDWPVNVKCVGRKITSTTTLKPTTTEMEAKKCPLTNCKDSTVYLPSLENARQFIRCQNGKEVYEYCPNGLVFDVKLKVCNFEHLAQTVGTIT